MHNLNQTPNSHRLNALPSACFVMLLTGSSMLLPAHQAHAHIFDPVLRVLLPFYNANDSINIKKQTNENKQNKPSSNQTASQSSVKQTTTNPTASKKEALPNEQLEQNIADSSATLPSSQNKPAKQTNQTNKTTTQQSKLAHHQPTKTFSSSINQKLLASDTTNTPALLEPSLYELLDAEFAYDRGNTDKALAIYKQQAFGKDATAIFERALTLSLAHEDVTESLKFASTWQKQNPDHVPAWFYVAHLALRAHEYDLAGNTLEKILEYDPKADFSQILQGIYPETDSDKKALLETLQQLYSEENANLSILQAGLLLELNNPKQALVKVNNALKSEPNNTPFITLKADILRQLNDRKALFKLLGQARKKLPNEKALYLYEIRYRLDNQPTSQPSDPEVAQAQEDNINQAWNLLLKTTKRFPDDPEITLLASLVSLDTQNYSAGDKLLTSLLDRPAYIDQAYYYLGISAERQNRYQDAQAYFTNVMQEDLVLEARKKVVAYQLIQNETDSAINTLVALRRDFPIYAPDSYILQSDILKQLQQTSEAKALLAQVSQDFPNNSSVKFAYAKLMTGKEERIAKQNILQTLRKQAPNNLAYQLEFAKLLLDKNPTSAEGKQLATEVVNTPYSDPRFDRNIYLDGLNTLAKAELAQQNYTQVLSYLQTIYKALPTIESGVLLLQAYQGLGETERANDLRNELQQRFNYSELK